MFKLHLQYTGGVLSFFANQLKVLLLREWEEKLFCLGKISLYMVTRLSFCSRFICWLKAREAEQRRQLSGAHKHIKRQCGEQRAWLFCLRKQARHQDKTLSVGSIERERKPDEKRHFSHVAAAHLALRHRWGQVECAPNWQSYTAASRQTYRPTCRLDCPVRVGAMRSVEPLQV